LTSAAGGARPLRVGCALAALALSGASPAPATRSTPSAPTERGTYRLEGTAHVDATPFGRDVEVRADAVIRPGSGPRELRVRIASQGQVCELVARLGDAGALVFAAGQVCPIALEDPDMRGHVEARLRAGRGRIGDGRLAVELAFDLTGSVRLAARSLQVFGAELPVPAALATDVPVKGLASASVAGRRDESRAADR
jgi:hypothetical protein